MKSRVTGRRMEGFCLTGLLLWACGGGGGTVGKSISAPITSQSSTTPGTTAHFHVDVSTGKITIINGKSVSTSARTIFAGTTVSFNSSTLYNSANANDNGTRVMNVSLQNNSGLALGSTYGLNVEFSNFANVGTFPDVRSLTNVATLANGFYNPYGVVAAGNGTFYVADTFHNQIKLVSGGNVSLFAGNGSKAEADGPASTASFNLPVGIALLNGNLIVADYGGNKIRQISPSGQVTTLVTAATFNGPWGLATDGVSNIFVSEKGSNDIREISSGAVTVLAGGSAGNQDGVGNAAKFYNIEGIAYSNGFVYGADSGNNSIRQISVSTGAVITIAGTGAVGHTDGVGNVATLSQPAGVTVINGAVIASEGGSNLNVNLRQITPIQGTVGSNSTSWQTSTIAGNGYNGYFDGVGSTASFNNPNLISSDPSGNIYIADTNNNIVREVTPDNGIFPIGVPAGGVQNTDLVQLANPSGAMDSATAGVTFPYINYPGAIQNGQFTASKLWSFNVPAGVNAFEFDVTVESAATVPISVGGLIGSGDPTEIVSTYAGILNQGGFLVGPTNQARFQQVLSEVWTPEGLFVADAYNQTIDLITSSGQVYTIAGARFRYGIDGTGNQAGFNFPSGIAADSQGNLYVSDAPYPSINPGSCVRLLTFNGGTITSALNWTVTTIAGNQSKSGATDGVGTSALFLSMAGIAIDSAGDIFVTDSSGDNVRILIPGGGLLNSPLNWTVETFAGPAGTLAAQPGFRNGQQSNASFDNPQGIAISPTGTIYICDRGNNAIREISRDGNVTTIINNPSAVTVGYQDGPAGSAEANQPIAATFDSAGYFYFSDQAGLDLRKLSPNGTVSTIVGTSSSTSADGPGNAARLNQVFGLSVSPSGDIYIGDTDAIRLVQKELTVGTNSKAKSFTVSNGF